MSVETISCPSTNCRGLEHIYPSGFPCQGSTDRPVRVTYPYSLPPSSSMEGVSYEAILTVTCQLTKRKHYIPVVNQEPETAADAVLRHVIRDFGVIQRVVTDRGPQFVSSFWKELCLRLGIKRLLSTAHHPQTDGQSERSNQVMEL